MKKEYTTGNKRIVTDFFEKNREHHFTIDTALEKLEEENISIPKSSLYRTVGALCRAGILKRFESSEADSFVYQYANFDSHCDSHFHLKCTSCGLLIHLECDQMNKIKKHIMDEHGFIIGGDGIINGICRECHEKGYGQTHEAHIL